jgi:alpha-mannosidase
MIRTYIVKICLNVMLMLLLVVVQSFSQTDKMINNKILWHIGISDKSHFEFSLAPTKHLDYSEEGYYIIGKSNPANDWPFIHPGPIDKWAGSRQHTFTILFGLESITEDGQCCLTLDLVDTHPYNSTDVIIEINGQKFSHTLPIGGGVEVLGGQLNKCKNYQIQIPFPTSILKVPDNEIKITSVSGGWFLYDHIALTVPDVYKLIHPSERILIRDVKCLPFLSEKNGNLVQPVKMKVINTGEDKEVNIIIDTLRTISRIIKTGSSLLLIDIPEVTKNDSMQVEVKDKNLSIIKRRFNVKPASKITIYVLPHSHTDIGYTDIQTAIEDQHVINLQKAIEYARATLDYPPGARFIWNVEVLWAADLYLQRMSEKQRHEFFEAVNKGWIVLNGAYLNLLTGLARPEELLRLFRFSTQMAQQCNKPIDAVMISDIPGHTWGIVTAMAKAGIRYFSTGPNFFDRIGDTHVQWENKPFYWLSPCAKESLLVWVPFKGYQLSHLIGKMSSDFVEDYLHKLDSIKYPYDITYIRWSGRHDNDEPDPTISDFVKEWNEQHVWPKFVISSVSETFKAFEEKYGKQLPRIKGDWTPYWEDGAGSSAFETSINRQSSDRLTQAQVLWSMINPEGYPVNDIEEAWKKILLYSEHTWGAWCSVSDPESKMTKDQWDIKRSYAIQGSELSIKLLERALKQKSEKMIPSVIDVYNTSSWEKTDLVVVSKELSLAGDKVIDNKGIETPSQRLKNGDLAFIVKNIPPLSSKRYRIVEGEAFVDGAVTISGTTLDNDLIKLHINETSGGIDELIDQTLNVNFVSDTSIYKLNDYVFLQGDDINNLQSANNIKITIKETGPLVASLLVESGAPGCNALSREVELVAGFDHVRITNTVDKKRVDISSSSEEEEFTQRKSKESVNFAFPFAVQNGSMNLDVPFAVIQPEKDQIPGACKNWLTIGSWADVSNDSYGVTWVTLDAPLVELGELSARLLGSQSDPDVWRKKIEPTQTIYSWVMNNHWGTNYRAYQDGITVFRYAIQPHKQYAPDASSRFAISLSQPLVVAPAYIERTTESLFEIVPESVILISLKPSDDGSGYIFTLLNSSQKNQRLKFLWNSFKPSSLWLSNTSEKRIKKLEEVIELLPWEVITLRTE